MPRRSSALDHPELPQCSQLFTVRVWREDLGERGSEWRGKVQHLVFTQIRRITAAEVTHGGRCAPAVPLRGQPPGGVAVGQCSAVGAAEDDFDVHLSGVGVPGDCDGQGQVSPQLAIQEPPGPIG